MKIAFGRKDQDLDGCKIQLISPLKRQKEENDSIYGTMYSTTQTLVIQDCVSLQSTRATPTCANVTSNHSPNPALLILAAPPRRQGLLHISASAHAHPSPPPQNTQHLLILVTLFMTHLKITQFSPILHSPQPQEGSARDLPRHCGIYKSASFEKN